MKKLILSVFLLVAVLALAESANAFHLGRDYLRAQLLFRSPDAGPIYFRGGLISNLYGDLPAKYSPQDGQIHFPHYFLGSYGYPGGVLAYRPTDYMIYGKPFWNYGSYAGYAPEQNYGTYPYDMAQYAQRYGFYGSYGSFGGYGGYGNYGWNSMYGYGGYGGGYGGYGNSYGNYGFSGLGGPSSLYTGYETNIYPGPNGWGGNYPQSQTA